MPVYEPKREEEVCAMFRSAMLDPCHKTPRGVYSSGIIDEMRTLQRMRMSSTRDGEWNRHSCRHVSSSIETTHRQECLCHRDKLNARSHAGRRYRGADPKRDRPAGGNWASMSTAQPA